MPMTKLDYAAMTVTEFHNGKWQGTRKMTKKERQAAELQLECWRKAAEARERGIVQTAICDDCKKLMPVKNYHPETVYTCPPCDAKFELEEEGA